MKIVANAEANKIAEDFVELGWRVEGRKKHVVLRNPENPAETITLSLGAAAHGWEHLKRLKSKLRRATAAKEAI
jgi:hypothetical protein